MLSFYNKTPNHSKSIFIITLIRSKGIQEPLIQKKVDNSYNFQRKTITKLMFRALTLRRNESGIWPSASALLVEETRNSKPYYNKSINNVFVYP